MGGFNWEINKLPDGNYKVLANDVWDLHPFRDLYWARHLKKGTIVVDNKLINTLADKFKNIEVGKALGIGKPLNVKVGFILDGETKKIINTFGLAPAAAVGAAELSPQQNEEQDTSQYQQGGAINNTIEKNNTKKYQSGGYPDLWPTNIPYLQGAFGNFNLAPLGQNFVNFGDNQFGAQIMGNIGKNSIYGDLFGGNAFKDPGKWGGDVAKGFENDILEQDKKKYGVTSFESAGLKWAKENGFSFSSPGEALKAYEKDIQG